MYTQKSTVAWLLRFNEMQVRNVYLLPLMELFLLFIYLHRWTATPSVATHCMHNQNDSLYIPLHTTYTLKCLQVSRLPLGRLWPPGTPRLQCLCSGTPPNSPTTSWATTLTPVCRAPRLGWPATTGLTSTPGELPGYLSNWSDQPRASWQHEEHTGVRGMWEHGEKCATLVTMLPQF